MDRTLRDFSRIEMMISDGEGDIGNCAPGLDNGRLEMTNDACVGGRKSSVPGVRNLDLYPTGWSRPWHNYHKKRLHHRPSNNLMLRHRIVHPPRQAAHGLSTIDKRDRRTTGPVNQQSWLSSLLVN